MIIELYTELEQLYYRRKENKWKLEEEIRKLEAKIYIPKEANETSEPSKDRKSSREQRKHPYQRSSREPSPIKKYISAASYDREERQIRHFQKAHTSSSGKRSQGQESVNKVYTTIKVFVSKHSNFLFKINDSLSIIWDKPRRRFVLRCPLYFKMEIHLHRIQPLRNYDPTLNPITKLSLRLSGITILDQNGILFLFQPTLQWAGMFHVFHIGTSNGLTLYLTKKAILEQMIIPKGTILGYLYVIAQLQEWYSHQLMYIEPSVFVYHSLRF